MNPSPIRAGATVTHPHFPLLGLPEWALVVELHATGLAELDNGQALPAQELTPVETGERWVPVAGYDGRYLVSDQGRVVATSYNRRAGRERLLKVQRPATYPLVELSKGPDLLRTGLNRLVAQHFLPAPADPSHTHLLPLDGNHLNLAATNWRWVPVAATGAVVAERRRAAGQPHPSGKLTPAQHAAIREQVASGRTYRSVAAEYAVSAPAVLRIAKKG